MAAQVWASGKRKHVPGTKKKTRRRRPRIKRYGVLAAVWAIITALFTIAWFTIGGALWFVAAVFGALAAVMATIAAFDPDDAVPTPKPIKPKSASPRGDRRSAAAVPPCTNTGKPIDQCPCSRRHVASSDGARRYKRAVGAPMGGKAPTKPSTTKKASP